MPQRHTIAPRIYVACLASYNAGRLYGAWIDCNQDADAIRDDVQQMLAGSPEPGAEEFAIHDAEGLGKVGEFADLDRIAAVGQAVAAAGDDAPALLAWLDCDPSRDPDTFADCYLGQFDSAGDYARGYWEQAGWQPADDLFHPSAYVDFAAMGADMVAAGELEEHAAPGGGVWLFSVR